jgi:hypothetical protein
MTKEMTASHREDILSDALYFYAKKQRSKNGIHILYMHNAFFLQMNLIYTFYLSDIVMLLNAQMQRCTELLSHSTSEIEELRENSPGKYTEQCMCSTGICLQNFLIICYRAIKQVYSTGIDQQIEFGISFSSNYRGNDKSVEGAGERPFKKI